MINELKIVYPATPKIKIFNKQYTTWTKLLQRTSLKIMLVSKININLGKVLQRNTNIRQDLC